MIDNFALGIVHFLLALTAWRLIMRADLNADPAPVETAAKPEGSRARIRPQGKTRD